MTVNVSDQEHFLPILCYERGQPEDGFVTDRGPRENLYRSVIHLTGLPVTDARDYRVVLTDGAEYESDPGEAPLAVLSTGTATLKVSRREPPPEHDETETPRECQRRHRKTACCAGVRQ